MTIKTVTFQVVGDDRLACEGCERRVERVLKALPGVSQVRAHAGNQQIQVLFDASVVDTGAIADRIEKSGYRTTVSS